MTKYGFSALVAAGLLVGGLTASSASAADLGGNCCADLEERIAELEATTARKGNRKVSLTISGWVGQEIMWWDNSEEQNVYIGGLGVTLASHFKMTGQAIIAPGWSAGYVLHMEFNDADSLVWNEDSPHQGAGLGNLPSYGAVALQTYWFIKSDHLGKISLGLQSSATDNAAVLVDGSGSLVPANWVMFDYGQFGVVNNAGALSGITIASFGGSCRGGGGVGGDCFGAPRDSIVYNTPTWHGFNAGASWGEDDFWDVAARYAGEWVGFKVAAVAAYSEWCNRFAASGITCDGQGGFGGLGLQGAETWSQYFQAGLYVQHVPTGIWGLVNYGHIETDGLTNCGQVASGACNASVTVNPLGISNGNGGNAIQDGETWYFKAGLRERWHPLGHTVIYGEYAQYEDSLSDAFINAGFAGAETQMWGAGIVQEIDAAAMSMWLTYRHIDVSASCLAPGLGDSCIAIRDEGFEDFQKVTFGALINF